MLVVIATKRTAWEAREVEDAGVNGAIDLVLKGGQGRVLRWAPWICHHGSSGKGWKGDVSGVEGGKGDVPGGRHGSVGAAARLAWGRARARAAPWIVLVTAAGMGSGEEDTPRGREAEGAMAE